VREGLRELGADGEVTWYVKWGEPPTPAHLCYKHGTLATVRNKAVHKYTLPMNTSSTTVVALVILLELAEMMVAIVGPWVLNTRLHPHFPSRNFR
jgi:hypothetical protein